MAQVSIVIPAYNEEQGILNVLERIRSLSLDAEVIVVDDGSTDRTSEVAREHGAEVFRRAGNVGYGRAIKDGMGVATTDTIVITDADGTYPVEDIPKLLEEFHKGFDMVVGARRGMYYRGSLLKMPARFCFKMLAEFTAGRKIPDVNSGLRVFRKSTAESFGSDPLRYLQFHDDTHALLHAHEKKWSATFPFPTRNVLADRKSA